MFESFFQKMSILSKCLLPQLDSFCETATHIDITIEKNAAYSVHVCI